MDLRDHFIVGVEEKKRRDKKRRGGMEKRRNGVGES